LLRRGADCHARWLMSRLGKPGAVASEPRPRRHGSARSGVGTVLLRAAMAASYGFDLPSQRWHPPVDMLFVYSPSALWRVRHALCCTMSVVRSVPPGARAELAC